jgi:putative glutamine amidotransferase
MSARDAPETPRPVLGIICCTRTVGVEPAQAVMNRYLMSSLTFADAAGLLVPSLPELMHAREVAPRIDGLLLTGTPSNVEPARYGDPVEESEGPFDPARDEMTLRLVEAMIEQKKPVFGICRGFQELNVAFGGTLRRDTADSPDLIAHHGVRGSALPVLFEHRHPVALEKGGILSGAYGKDELDVISVHLQGADRLGDGLKVEATAPDGVIEAVSAEVNGAQVLAVQWHPEWKTAENPESQVFFNLLGRALRREPLRTS